MEMLFRKFLKMGRVGGWGGGWVEIKCVNEAQNEI
jgi:hypothetical protein